MSITAAEFRTRFPEFVSETNPTIDLFVADSVVIINEAYWGTKYDLGLYYLTAHYLTLANRSASGSTASIGAVASKSVDGVSIAYATATPNDGSDAYYNSTAYGQRYLALRKTLGVAAHVI